MIAASDNGESERVRVLLAEEPRARRPQPQRRERQRLLSVGREQVHAVEPQRRRLAGQKKQTKNTPRSGRGTGVWWQPLLPAMAKDRCDHMLPKPKPGSGRNGKRARALVREQQKIWTHAVRIEGTRRARIYKQAKIEREGDRVKAVYREFADILRARALSQKAAEDAAGATTASGSSSSSDAPPAA